MAGYLSPGWVDGLALPAPARSVRVRRVVTGGPDGDLALDATLPGADGAASADGAATPGADGDGPALTLTTTHEVASRLDAGEVPVAVAYMQGRLKAEGDMPTLYALLAATTPRPG